MRSTFRWHKNDFSDLPESCKPQRLGDMEVWTVRQLLAYRHEVRRRIGRYASACRWVTAERTINQRSREESDTTMAPIDNQKLASDLRHIRQRIINLCPEGTPRRLTRAAGRFQRALDHLRFELSQATGSAVYWETQRDVSEASSGTEHSEPSATATSRTLANDGVPRRVIGHPDLQNVPACSGGQPGRDARRVLPSQNQPMRAWRTVKNVMFSLL